MSFVIRHYDTSFHVKFPASYWIICFNTVFIPNDYQTLSGDTLIQPTTHTQRLQDQYKYYFPLHAYFCKVNISLYVFQSKFLQQFLWKNENWKQIKDNSCKHLNPYKKIFWKFW